MTKEKMEIYQNLLTEKEIRRMNVVKEYLDLYGELLKKKVIAPNRVFTALGKKYNFTNVGIRFILVSAGVYKSSKEPIYYPTAEEMAAKPTYFFI